VDNCPHEVIRFGENSDLSSLIEGSETLEPVFGEKPQVKVHYLNLPKRFIAGTVYDPDSKEVVIGATCTLTGEGQIFTAITDDFGDFWFDSLKAGTFSLKIEKTPKSRTISNISTIEKDIGMGDVELS
jgi:hypothetical protein